MNRNKRIKETWLAEKIDKNYSMVNGYVQNRQQPLHVMIFEIAAIYKFVKKI